MNTLQRLLSSAMLSTSVIGFGCLGLSLSAWAGSKMMPPGYTLSKMQLKGQHCYRHNNETNLYCYPYKLTESMMTKHRSMMMKQEGGSMMMKKDDAMMMKKDGGSMMKKDDAMMKGQ